MKPLLAHTIEDKDIAKLTYPVACTPNDGEIKLKTKRLVVGVGINDSPNPINKRITTGRENGKQKQKTLWACPYYIVWADMLKRCYSEKYLEKYPTYMGCYVCNDWKYFSRFKSWMEAQEWEGKELDKDLLIKGNKVYSPDTCLFVDKQVNYILLTKQNSRGALPLGVRLGKGTGKYCAECNLLGKYRNLGTFLSIEDAHRAWKLAKIESIMAVIETQTDNRVINALLSRITYLKMSIENNEVVNSL